MHLLCTNIRLNMDVAMFAMIEKARKAWEAYVRDFPPPVGQTVEPTEEEVAQLVDETQAAEEAAQDS
jgi:hypothetical protein